MQTKSVRPLSVSMCVNIDQDLLRFAFLSLFSSLFLFSLFSRVRALFMHAQNKQTSLQHVSVCISLLLRPLTLSQWAHNVEMTSY